MLNASDIKPLDMYTGWDMSANSLTVVGPMLSKINYDIIILLLCKHESIVDTLGCLYNFIH